MFKFSLQTALKVRDIEEKRVMKELAEIAQVQQMINEKIARSYQRMAEIDQKVNEQKKSLSYNQSYLTQVLNFKKNKQFEIREFEQELEETRKKLEEKRQELVFKSRQKRTLEILKDKEYKKYLEDQKKQEANFIDEVANIQYAFRQGRAI